MARFDEIKGIRPKASKSTVEKVKTLKPKRIPGSDLEIFFDGRVTKSIIRRR